MAYKNGDTVSLDPNDVVIPESRLTSRAVRFDDMVDDIARHGQLDNIVVKSDLTLRTGCRRTLACRQLGIPVRAFIKDDGDDLELEAAENNIREGATFSEKIAYTTAMYERLRKEIGERRGRPSKSDSGNSADSSGILSGQETRDYVARLCGWSSRNEMCLALEIAQKGKEPLIKALDDGNIKSITEAQRIARAREGMQVKMVERLCARDSLPPDEFDKLIEAERREKKERIRKRISMRSKHLAQKDKYEFIWVQPDYTVEAEVQSMAALDLDELARDDATVVVAAPAPWLGHAYNVVKSGWNIQACICIHQDGTKHNPWVQAIMWGLVIATRGKRPGILKPMPCAIQTTAARLSQECIGIAHKWSLLSPNGLNLYATERAHGLVPGNMTAEVKDK